MTMIVNSINNVWIYKLFLFTTLIHQLADGISTAGPTAGPSSGPTTAPIHQGPVVSTYGPTGSPAEILTTSGTSTGSSSIIIYAVLAGVGFFAIVLIVYSLYYRKIKILEAGEEVLLDFGNAYPNAGDKDGPQKKAAQTKGRKPGQGKIEAQLESGMYFENEMRKKPAASPAKATNEPSKPLTALSVPEVAYLMVALNFAQFAKSFVNSEINGEMLAEYNLPEDLTKAGVVMPAPFARSLLKVLAECKEKGVPLRFIKVREIYTASTKPTKEEKAASKPAVTTQAASPSTAAAPTQAASPTAAPAVAPAVAPVAAAPVVDKKPPPPPPPPAPRVVSSQVPPLVTPASPTAPTTAATPAPAAAKSPQLAGSSVTGPSNTVAWTPKPKQAAAPVPTGPKYPRKPAPPTERTKPLAQVTLNEVNRLLASMDLNEFAPSFIANGVNGRKLNDLNSEDPEVFKENCKVNMPEEKAILFLLDLSYFKEYGVPKSRFEKGFPPSSPTLLAQSAPLPPEEKPKAPEPVLGPDAKLLSDLTVEEVSSVLVALKLQAFVDTFRNNNVNGFLLSEVTSVEELKECGVVIPGPFARTLLKDVAEFKATGVPLALLKVEAPVKLAENSKKLADLTVEEVGLLLTSIKLTQFVSKFAESGINGFILSEVKTNEELKECGVVMPGPFAKSLLKEIEPFRIAGVPLDRIQAPKSAESAKPSATSKDKASSAVVPLQTLNVAEVAYLMVGLNLGPFARSFVKKEVDGLTLAELKYPADVAALGVPMPDDVALSLLTMLEKCKSKGVPLKLIQPPEKPAVESPPAPPTEPATEAPPVDNSRVPLISLSSSQVAALLVSLNLGSFSKAFVKNDVTGLILSELKTIADIIAIGIAMPEATAKSLLQVIEKCNNKGVPLKLIQLPGEEKPVDTPVVPAAASAPAPAPAPAPTSAAPTSAAPADDERVPLISLNARQVGALLTSLNLGTFAPTFEQNDVTGLILSELNSVSDIDSVGVTMSQATAKSLLQVIEKCNTKGVPVKLLKSKSDTSATPAPVTPVAAPVAAPPTAKPVPTTTPTPAPSSAPAAQKPVAAPAAASAAAPAAPTPAPAAPAAAPAATPGMIPLAKLNVADVATLMASLNMPTVGKIFQGKNIDGPALAKLTTLASVTALGVPEATAKPLMGVLEKCRTKGVPPKLLPNFRLSVATAAPAAAPATAPVAAPASSSAPLTPAVSTNESGPTKPLTALTIVEVGKMLDSLSLSKYVPSFVQNGVNGFVLKEVTTVDELKNCGVTMPGPFARTLLTELKLYREQGVPLSVIGSSASQQKPAPQKLAPVINTAPSPAAPKPVGAPSPAALKPVPSPGPKPSSPAAAPSSVPKPVAAPAAAPTSVPKPAAGAPSSVPKPVAAPSAAPTAPTPAPAAAPAATPGMIPLAKLNVADVATLMASLNMPTVGKIFQGNNIDGPALAKLTTLASVTALGVPEATAKPLMGVLEKCRTKGVPPKLVPGKASAAAPAAAPAAKPAAAPLVPDKGTQQLLNKVNEVSSNIAAAKSTAGSPPVAKPTPPAAPSSSASGTVSLESLSMDQVLKLLESANLSQYASGFVDNKLSGPALTEILTVDDLKDCGVKMPGPFARLFIKDLASYREGGVPVSKLQ